MALSSGFNDRRAVDHSRPYRFADKLLRSLGV
jgi:hypothetical protein